MGWTFPYGASRKYVIAELTDHYVSENKLFERTCLAKCYKGSNFKGTLYAVFENRHFNGDEAVRFIFVAMLQCRKMDGKMSWGYKDMEESMGPCQCGCPVSYFDLVPVVPNASAERWRERCRLQQRQVALRVKLNRAIRRGEVDPRLAKEQYNEFLRQWAPMLDRQEEEFKTECASSGS